MRVDDPAGFAGRVLRAEAPDIPEDKINRQPWALRTLRLEQVAVDEAMVALHDDDPVHLQRRDGFVQMARAGEPWPPLIALGVDRFLVDGYARIRALRLLSVGQALVVLQDT